MTATHNSATQTKQLFFITLSVVAWSLLTGGGTSSIFVTDVLGQLLAVPLLVLAIMVWRDTRHDTLVTDRRVAAWLLLPMVLIFLLVLLQVAPLGLNSAKSALVPATFPGLDPTSVLPETWRLITVTPEATAAAGLSFLAPLAIFIATGCLDYERRQQIVTVIIVFGLLGALLGFLQMAQGPNSALRFYSFTNPTEAVGFFANRNHFAAQLFVIVPLGGAWIVARADAQLKSRRHGSLAPLELAGYAAALLLIFAAAALARSRAGMGLMLLAAAGVGLLALTAPTPSTSGKRTSIGTRAILVVLVAGLLLALHFGTQRVFSRLEISILDDLRWPLLRTTLETAWAAFPFGTGLGSFVRVYGVVEKPEHIFAGFANRAHNDLAEFLLETGLPGAVLLLLFFAWYLRATFRAWTAASSDPPLAILLRRAATIAIALVLVHSLVDYPLRTAAHAVTFAVLCGLLLPAPGPEAPPPRTVTDPPKRPRSSSRSPRYVPTPVTAEPGKPWKGGNVQWPDAWAGDGKNHTH